MRIVKKVFNITLTVLIICVLLVSVYVAVMSLTTKASGISNIFGYTVQVIQSDSMKGGSDEFEGGDFEHGDVIIGKVTDFDATRTYSIGDIVTYKGFLEGVESSGEQLICHRIVDAQQVDGTVVYQTQGDNRQISQVPDQNGVDEYISGADIGAYFHTSNYDGIVIKGIGNFYDYINTQMGFFLCVLLPMIVFFLIVLVRFVINFVNFKNAKEMEKRERKNHSSESVDTSDQQSSDTQVPQLDADQYEQFKQFMAFQNAQKAVQQEQSSPAEDAEQTPTPNEADTSDE